jgi:hypothetical protein
MRPFHLGAVPVLVALGVSSVVGQEQPTRAPGGAVRAAPQASSPGHAAIERAAVANRYVFIFFWKEKNQQTDKAWGVFQPAGAKMADWADVVSIQATDPAEQRVVDRFGVSRAPMPLVLAVAPCGAITKALTGSFDENRLRAAWVSPCTQLCLRGLQNRRLVFVCVVEQGSPQEPVAIPQGVQEFRADEKYGPATEIVLLNARDEGEATFLRELQVDPRTPKPVTVFLAPPGSVIGKFDGAATKQQLVAKLVSAQTNPCAGGKCGPNGCGPKK